MQTFVPSPQCGISRKKISIWFLFYMSMYLWSHLKKKIFRESSILANKLSTILWAESFAIINYCRVYFSDWDMRKKVFCGIYFCDPNVLTDCFNQVYKKGCDIYASNLYVFVIEKSTWKNLLEIYSCKNIYTMSSFMWSNELFRLLNWWLYLYCILYLVF